MTPIQDIAVLVLAFALGLTVGLMLCYLICRKSTDLVVQQRPNQPVEQPATPARRRQCQQRIGKKEPIEHDECLLWVSSETAAIQNFSVTCERFAICLKFIFVRRMERYLPTSCIDSNLVFGSYSLAKTEISNFYLPSL